jgi:O-antigen biosynthesis protein
VKFNFPLSTQPLVSILIVALEGDNRLRQCFRALERNLPRDVPLEIIVVLCRFNARVVTKLRAVAPGVTFFWCASNLGMAGGMNMARSLATGKYLVALHDDARIRRGWLEALVAAAEANPLAGAVGSMTIRPDRYVQYAGAILWSNGLTAPTHLGQPRPRPSEVTTARPVDYSGTSSLLVRADVFDAIGGCDEAFYPAYYVDVNIAMGLRQAGRYVMVEPASRILHEGGGSSTPRYRRFVAQRNKGRFIEKWAAMLPDFEPYPTSDAVASVRAALERSAAFAAQCIAKNASLVPRPVARLDITEQQRRHIEIERELKRDYVAMLEGRLDTTEKQVHDLEARLNAPQA